MNSLTSSFAAVRDLHWKGLYLFKMRWNIHGMTGYSRLHSNYHSRSCINSGCFSQKGTHDHSLTSENSRNKVQMQILKVPLQLCTTKSHAFRLKKLRSCTTENYFSLIDVQNNLSIFYIKKKNLREYKCIPCVPNWHVFTYLKM